MEPQGKEIYEARVKAGLEKIGLGEYYDGRTSIAIRVGPSLRLMEVDLSATAPDKMMGIIFSRIYQCGHSDGYQMHKSALKDLIG